MIVIRELSSSRLLVDIGGSCRRYRSMLSWRAPLLLAVVVVGVVLGWKWALYWDIQWVWMSWAILLSVFVEGVVVDDRYP